MAKRLFISDLAKQDLQSIFNYGLQNFGELKAGLFIDKFQDAFSLLCEFDIGTEEKGVGIDLLRYVMEHYVIFFTRTSELVKIVRVLHGSQDINKQFS